MKAVSGISAALSERLRTMRLIGTKIDVQGEIRAALIHLFSPAIVRSSYPAGLPFEMPTPSDCDSLFWASESRTCYSMDMNNKGHDQ